MFVSDSTLQGLRVTITSVIHIVDFIFDNYNQEEFPYILTGRLNQDPLEVYIYFKPFFYANELNYYIFKHLSALVWIISRHGRPATSANLQIHQAAF